jgi:hypothetical protein
MLQIAAPVASIALFQSGHRFGERHDRLFGMGRIGSAGRLLAARHASRETISARNFFVIIFLLSLAFLSQSLSRLKRCKIRWANGAMITDAIPIKANPENKA